MSISLSKLIRDRIADDATMKTLLGVTTTGSASFFPAYDARTGIYPQIIYTLADGPTDPGMNSQQGVVTFSVQVKGTGNAHLTYGNIINRLSGLFDDQSLSGGAISGTSVNGLLFLRSGGYPVTYDDARQIYSKIISYGYRVIGG